MNKRSLSAIAAASCAGFLAAWTVDVMEPVIRTTMEMPPALDDSAARIARAVMLPLFILGFPVFCWLYILPMMRRFLGRFRMPGWRVLVSAFLTAAIMWLLFCVLLHSPRLDSIQSTAIAIGAVVWWPVFAASCAAGCIIAKTVPVQERTSAGKDGESQPPVAR